MSIQVRHIQKRYGQFTALHDVSLDFNRGELVALLGPSGCGKTTLLRIIAGLESADRGQVLLDGEDASDVHVRERQVGFVFQHYALFRHMTVFDNVAFGLRMKPRKQRPSESAIRDKVMSLLNLVQLDWLSSRFPSELSGGQRQRIALARALAVEPRVLLLDEPFGALDAKVRKELRRWLRKLHEDLNVTSIFVTHDQEEALEVADRVVLMDHGQVEQVGTPQIVYGQPATPFVYGFLGSANRFEGVWQENSIQINQHHLPTPIHNISGDTVVSGQSVIAFARPHELDILPIENASSTSCNSQTTSVNGLPAHITRILDFGATANVELTLDGNTIQHYEAELTRGQLNALQLELGQAVLLRPTALKVFANTGSVTASNLQTQELEEMSI